MPPQQVGRRRFLGRAIRRSGLLPQATYDQLKQYDKAIADFTEAIRLKLDYADAFNDLGIGYDELKQCDKAIADYTRSYPSQTRPCGRL